MSVIFSLSGGLRLVALFNSGPSRFTSCISIIFGRSLKKDFSLSGVSIIV